MNKFELWEFISGSVRPSMLPSLECMPHWSNAGSLSWTDIGMLATMLKGEILRGYDGYREIGD